MVTTRKTLHAGRVVDLGVETFDAPNGQRMELEVVRHRGGAAVVALNESSEVCLVHQYRHAVGDWITELPAGRIDPNEQPGSTAARELEEEAGLQAKSWQDLGTTHPTPGFCDEVIHLYLATDISRIPIRHEADEFIEVRWVDFDAACRMALDSTISDAKTVIGLLRARALLDATRQ